MLPISRQAGGPAKPPISLTPPTPIQARSPINFGGIRPIREVGDVSRNFQRFVMPL